MLLYELITLKLPFEGQEQIKDIILNGGRPIIRSQELEYPTLMLDLMCLCWLDNPAERPNTQDILKYAESFEFSHLLDVAILDEYDKQSPLVVTCLNQEQDEADYELADEEEAMLNTTDNGFSLEDDEIEEEDMIDLWVVRNSLDEGVSQLEVLTYENSLNCTNRKQINVCNEKIEALCVYNGNQVWCVDSLKSIFVFW